MYSLGLILCFRRLFLDIVIGVFLMFAMKFYRDTFQLSFKSFLRILFY